MDAIVVETMRRNYPTMTYPNNNPADARPHSAVGYTTLVDCGPGTNPKELEGPAPELYSLFVSWDS